MSKQGYIQRYLLIIRLVRNNRYIPLSELVRKVEDGLAYYDDTDDIGVSRRTILRDLREIRSGMNISIEHQHRVFEAGKRLLHTGGRRPDIRHRKDIGTV